MSETPVKHDTQTQPPASSPPPPAEGRGIGCWVGGLLTVFIAGLLVIVGLFLPPINLADQLFGESYVRLGAVGDATVHRGLTLALAADNSGQGIEVNLSSVSLNDFEAANAEAGSWVPVAKGAVPYYLALQGPVYSIDSESALNGAVVVNLSLPEVASPDLLDIYGWSDEQAEWTFIPSTVTSTHREAIVSELPDRVAIFQTAPLPPTVRVTYDVTSRLDENAADIATIVSPGGLQPTLEGAITGSLAPGFDPNAAYMVMPVIQDYVDPLALDTETVEAIIGNSGLRQEHVRQIAALASGGGYDGIFIDYRGLEAAQRENFSAFIQDLSSSMRPLGLKLGVTIPAAVNDGGVWETGAYDWRVMGESADYVEITMGLNPALFTPGDNQPVEAMLRWGTGEIDRYKMLLGLSARSVREIAGDFTAVGYEQGLAGLGDVVVEAETVGQDGDMVLPGSEIRAYLDGRDALAGVDTLINTPFIDYLNDDGSSAARVWLGTGDALRFRMDSTIPFAIAGVSFSDLMSGDIAEGIYRTIMNYRTQIPSAAAPTDLALRWRIEGSDGLIDEVTTGINEDLVTTLDAIDGNYAINVAVVGIGQEAESPRSGAAVALFNPTSTPTPLPTSTPTPRPTRTPTPAPIVTAQPQPSGGGQPAAAPAAGSIAGGGFEYGGHVTSADSGRAIGAMQRAGMNWMKVQVRYYPGSGPEMAIGKINAARSNGFKILIGTVGNPNDLAGGGEAYIQGYAGWLGQIAAAGADAIEVWNEPNIDREWPTGQISGEAYANMLRQAYQAIKASNGSTMVISGAPAPTGAEAAYPGQVKNDDNFLREMVSAGGMNYLDCVGAHYNEGIVGPSQMSGDPRDSYYTRYFNGMVNTYWNITGGQKPLCFTELGYLTSEGFPPLPNYFAWAQNVTLGQQAAWLAEAAALASQSGRVRLMIVWNVDFTSYGADPQGGYAMIRPDGSCPACDTMAAAR